jgi:hypothetical protein
LESHRSKAEGLKEFARELLTVVAGIIIAIGLGQVVDAFHWQESVVEARDSLRQELNANDAFYAYRVAVSPCVGQRLAELNGIVEDAAAGRRVAPVGDLTLHLGDLMADDVWQSERAAQTLVHLPKKEFERFSRTYSQQIDIRAWLNQEIDAWAGLRVLEGDPNRLSPSDLALVRNQIQIARSLNFLVALNSDVELKANAALGVPKIEADQAAVRKTCAPLKRAPPSLPYTTY